MVGSKAYENEQEGTVLSNKKVKYCRLSIAVYHGWKMDKKVKHVKMDKKLKYCPLAVYHGWK
jgi:hypothetical protein